jgi:hypothetical protein
MASQTNPPPVAQLARAVGETFGHGGRYGGGTLGGLVGALAGEHLLPGIGGAMGGGIAGTVTGHLILDRLAELRLARGNALAALRPPPGPAINALSNLGYAAPVAVPPLTMSAPAPFNPPGR